MLCEKCKKNTATYHSRVVLNGMATEEHLCSECARNYNSNQRIFNSFSGGAMALDRRPFDDFFNIPSLSLFDFEDDIFLNNRTQKAEYSANYENLLNQAEKSIKIGAKNLSKNTEKKNQDERLELLRIDLLRAIDDEDYEKASEIKKQIDALKNNEKK